MCLAACGGLDVAFAENPGMDWEYFTVSPWLPHVIVDAGDGFVEIVAKVYKCTPTTLGGYTHMELPLGDALSPTCGCEYEGRWGGRVCDK